MATHGNEGRPHNIVHGSIESAIPEYPPLGATANNCGLSAIQADLQAIFDFLQIFGSKFWALGA